MMGGSGGGYFYGRSSPEDLAKRARQAEEKAQNEAFETDVAEYLADELAQYNERDVEGTRQVFESVKEDLEADVEGTVNLLFGGSVSKHTYVDGLSDVDALVLLDKTELKGKQPRDLQGYLVECLRGRYGADAVTVGRLAVTLDIEGKTIQLLPALRDGGKFKIASNDGRGWSKIDPGGFAAALTKANSKLDGKLVPCIKLTKAIVATFPKQRRLSGYHVESLAIQIFKDYNGPRTPKAMLQHFFEKAPVHISRPITDSTGQSVHVDEYLGEEHSIERRIVAHALNRIARKMRNADGAQSIERWRELFE